MALFVHVTDEKNTPAMRRSGIAMSTYGGGVYAMPVIPNFIVSHQWLRELRRGGARTLVGVYFRIDDDEPVRFGHYGKEPVTLTAAGAAASLRRAPDPLGLQIIIPRRITASEIHRIRHLPQLVGWRYHPKSHDFYCGCIMCVGRGAIKSKRKRTAYEAEETASARRRDALEKESERRRNIERFRKSAIAKASLLAVRSAIGADSSDASS